MPFTTQDRRELVDTGQMLPEDRQPGDACYYYYSHMVKQWKKEPRWTTAHNLYRQMIEVTPGMEVGSRAAYELAWQVFLQLYVMPYELKQRAVNGDI